MNVDNVYKSLRFKGDDAVVMPFELFSMEVLFEVLVDYESQHLSEKAEEVERIFETIKTYKILQSHQAEELQYVKVDLAKLNVSTVLMIFFLVIISSKSAYVVLQSRLASFQRTLNDVIDDEDMIASMVFSYKANTSRGQEMKEVTSDIVNYYLVHVNSVISNLSNTRRYSIKS